MNLSEQTQIILISKSKQLQLYHFPYEKLGNALPLLPWQGNGNAELGSSAGVRGLGLVAEEQGRSSQRSPDTRFVQGQLKGHIGTDPCRQGDMG